MISLSLDKSVPILGLWPHNAGCNKVIIYRYVTSTNTRVWIEAFLPHSEKQVGIDIWCYTYKYLCARYNNVALMGFYLLYIAHRWVERYTYGTPTPTQIWWQLARYNSSDNKRVYYIWDQWFRVHIYNWIYISCKLWQFIQIDLTFFNHG